MYQTNHIFLEAMESIPYIFLVEPPEAKYLSLKTIKIKCEIDYQVLNKDDYGGFLDALKMDYQSVIRKLVNSNGMPERWLDIRLPYTHSKEYVIFNILVQHGVKEIETSGKKLIYGHHFLLIFALPENCSGLNYKKIKKWIEECVKTKNNHFSLHWFQKQESRKEEHDFPIQLITNFNQEYQNIPFDQIQPIITESLKDPSNLIKIFPSKERSTKSKAILIKAIQILTTLFKVKNLIENKFPACAIISDKNLHKILSAKMSTYAISKATNRLLNAIKNKNLHKVAVYITSIYSNILIIQKRIKQKFEKYFDKIRKFPKLLFGDEVLRSLKIVYEILRWNLVIFKSKWLFQWNESTKCKITSSFEICNNSIGIIVTAENFPSETFFSHFSSGNLFWAIKDKINNSVDYCSSENNGINRVETSETHSIVVDEYSEPLLYFNSNEQNFGIITSQSFTGTSTVSRQIPSGLLIDLCQCGSDKIRLWICESCHCLISRLSNDKIICMCQRSNLTDVKKWCFQCMTLSHQNLPESESKLSFVSFAESNLEDSTSVPLTIPTSFSDAKSKERESLVSLSISTVPSSTPKNITKILIVQTKREKVCNGNFSTFSSVAGKSSYVTPSETTTKSETSKATLAFPESDDDLNED